MVVRIKVKPTLRPVTHVPAHPWCCNGCDLWPLQLYTVTPKTGLPLPHCKNEDWIWQSLASRLSPRRPRPCHDVLYLLHAFRSFGVNKYESHVYKVKCLEFAPRETAARLRQHTVETVNPNTDERRGVHGGPTPFQAPCETSKGFGVPNATFMSFWRLQKHCLWSTSTTCIKRSMPTLRSFSRSRVTPGRHIVAWCHEKQRQLGITWTTVMPLSVAHWTLDTHFITRS